MEGQHYQKDGQRITCLLCPHTCSLEKDQRGICQTRGHQDGKLISFNYGICTSLALDPVEKKPLYHFYPGGQILSVGTWGCNLKCPFCQNWTISQKQQTGQYISPQELVLLMKKYGGIGIAYTYSEPLVWYEYLMDTAPLVHEQGLANVLVTNGFINPDPWQKLLPHIDAVNIDLKAFDEGFYQKIVKGNLTAVLNNILEARKQCHLELTNLLVPGLNHEMEDLEAMLFWIVQNLGRDVPVHFSRYHPAHEMDAPATREEILLMAWQLAKEQLHYVYLGNYPGYANTHCPQCGQTVLRRQAMGLVDTNLRGKDCGHCGFAIAFSGEVIN